MNDTIKQKYQEYLRVIADKVTGKIVPEHDEDGHKYRFVDTGTLVRSVTTKIIVDRPHLVPWAVRIAFEWLEDKLHTINPSNRDAYIKGAQLASADIRDDAGDVGRQGHEAIENYCQDWITSGVKPKDIKKYLKPNQDPRVYAIARSVEKLFNDKPEYIPLAVEILVGHELLNTAGTLDALVMNIENGEVELWDWKSSNDVHDTYAMQVAVYKEMFEMMTGFVVDRAKIAHLSKEYDKTVLYEIPDVKRAFQAYRAISEVFDYINDGTEKLIKDLKTIEIDNIYEPGSTKSSRRGHS